VECTPKHLAGTGVGVQFGITAAGASVAPALFGVIADAWDIYAAFYFLAGVIIFANFLVVFVPNGDAHRVAAAPAR
jgi:FSR family fosmidomycin resistance protein-like MFS transporter